MKEFDAALRDHYDANATYSKDFEVYRSRIVAKINRIKKNAKVPRLLVSKSTSTDAGIATLIFEYSNSIILQIIGSILNYEKYCSPTSIQIHYDENNNAVKLCGKTTDIELVRSFLFSDFVSDACAIRKHCLPMSPYFVYTYAEAVKKKIIKCFQM